MKGNFFKICYSTILLHRTIIPIPVKRNGVDGIVLEYGSQDYIMGYIKNPDIGYQQWTWSSTPGGNYRRYSFGLSGHLENCGAKDNLPQRPVLQNSK